MRFRHGDVYTLRVHLKPNASGEFPDGLVLRHENQEQVELPLRPEPSQDLELTFHALSADNEPITDSEAHMNMRTVVVDAQGQVQAEIEWKTVINDDFEGF